MEVSWSKVGAIRRMLEDFPLEILQHFICLVGSMGTLVVMQEQQLALSYTLTHNITYIQQHSSIAHLPFTDHCCTRTRTSSLH
jgi:hypothetical protein